MTAKVSNEKAVLPVKGERLEPAPKSPGMILRSLTTAQNGLVAFPFLALAAGAAFYDFGRADTARWVWIAGVLPVLVMLCAQIVHSFAKGEFGLDVIAALAMAGAVAADQALAGVVVALMFAGGQALEAFAQGRAEREMTALMGRIGQTAQVYRGTALETVAIEALRTGDKVLIRSGEVVPVDGAVASSAASVDESALTGEALPVEHTQGSAIASGVINAGPPFDLTALRPASESTYAGIVRLVQSARHSKAPMSRLADRYAVGFLVVTLALTGAAWLITGDSLRALAVLVIATPCPLILAVPVAIVAGMSRCAKRGVLVKSARALEAMANIKTLLVDKTGTLTDGRPKLVAVNLRDGETADQLIRSAGSLAQASQHVVSQAIVAEAHARGLPLTLPAHAVETAGAGLRGLVDNIPVSLGRAPYVYQASGKHATLSVPGFETARPGATTVTVAVDHQIRGELVFADTPRPDAAITLQRLRAAGVQRIVLVTGDQQAVADALGRELSFDAVVSDITPGGKVAVVRKEAAAGPAMMIGDGINDAPALAAADVGVAMGARGAAAASEAADVVVLVDRLDRIAEAMTIAKRTRKIAQQSAVAGLGLSLVGMIAAAFGYLPPLAGALFQEVIDTAVVLNALRALKGPRASV